MKAWVIKSNKQLEKVDVPIPVIKEDEVLVKIQSSCLCNGSDPGIYNGHEAYPPPFIFGHEASGEVIEVGSEVQGISVGDRVFCWCAMGAFAEYQAMSQKSAALFRVPDTVPTEQAPILELVIASCRALMNRKPKDGNQILTICGAGPSGLVLLQYAKALGYRKVFVWDLYESRRRLALELGADQVFDPAELSADQLLDIPQSDLCVDMFGDDKLEDQPTLTLLIRAAKQNGTIISYGHPENGRFFLPYVLQTKNLAMVSPENDLNEIRIHGREVLALVEQGRIKIAPLISRVEAFDEVGSSFQHLLEQPEDQIKVVFLL